MKRLLLACLISAVATPLLAQGDKPMAGEENWGEPAPISLQPFGESGGFVGKVQFRNITVRTP